MADTALEAAIDAVGRQRVLDAALALGWQPEDSVPKFIWWAIVRDLRDGQAPAGVADG